MDRIIRMTEKKAIRELKKLQKHIDKGPAIARAGEVLCEFLKNLGYNNIVEEYENMFDCPF